MDIKEYLFYQNISAVAFAKNMNVSYPTFRNWVNRISLPNLETLYEIEKMTEGKVTLYDWLAENNPHRGKKNT